MYNPLARLRNFYYISSARANIIATNFMGKMIPTLQPFCADSVKGATATTDLFIKHKNEFFAREKIFVRYIKTLYFLLEDMQRTGVPFTGEDFLEAYESDHE